MRALALGVVLVQALAVGHGALVAHTSARDGALSAATHPLALHADAGPVPAAHLHRAARAEYRDAEERCALDQLLRSASHPVTVEAVGPLGRAPAAAGAPSDAPRASRRALLLVAPKASPPGAA